MNTPGRTLAAISLTIVALLGLGAIASALYVDDGARQTPIVYSKKDMLQEMWAAYKRTNIEPGTNRTLDKQQNNISTSEGQSYTMLRAVWMDDRATFDKSWKWTKDNLQRDDSLMAWKFGELPNGTYGIQDTIGGQNTASDGDSDIALALLMAYSRWQEDDYLYDAQPIIRSIWEREVVMIEGKPVLVANNLERDNPVRVIVNPSYLSPYAYKIFAKVDKQHDWNALADNSYTILKEVSDQKLDTKNSAGLPPDWITINRQTGEMQALDNKDLTTKFSFDAIRTPWRMALDYAWFKDPRSKEVLSRYTHLSREWEDKGRLAAAYSHDGKARANYETPATYGATIGYFKVMDQQKGQAIYKQKLSSLYDPDEQRPKRELGYYDDNWAWFGTALYLDELPNLTANQASRR